MDLNEHLAKARAKRWSEQTPEKRKEHSAKMLKARWGTSKTSTGEK